MARTIYVNNFIKAIIKRTDLFLAISNFAFNNSYDFVPFTQTPTDSPDPDDILIIWNRHNNQDIYARIFERAGATVIVFENPYLKIEPNPKEWFSCGISIHNNYQKAIRMQDNGQRWESFGFDIKPWRKTGDHILVCTQSKNFNGAGLGHKDYRQPEGWDSFAINQIRKRTDRPIRFRAHPNGYPSEALVKSHFSNIEFSDGKCPIENDLDNAWCSVIHSSNAATESLLNGVPVLYTGLNLFSGPVCEVGFNSIEKPRLSDNRKDIFRRMAWNQYHVSEISSGFFFNQIFKTTGKNK